MFWGLIMEPGRCYTQTVKVSFHVSMAALDISNASDEPAQVMCVFEGRNYLLCTLNKKDKLQCPLDLNFEAGTKVSFATNGKSHVHLTGYLTTMEDEFDEEQEEEEEEETVPTLSKKDKKRLKKELAEGPPKKKSKVVKNSISSSAEEVDEETSDSDFDLDKLTEEDDDDDDEDAEEGEEGDDDELDEASSLSEEESEEEQEEVKPKQNGIAKPSSTPKLKQQKKKESEKPQSPKEKPKKQGEKKEQKQQPKGKTMVLKGGVTVQDLKEGNGEAAKHGKFVHVYYEGRLKENNKMFDSTTKGPGFSFRVGKGEVIKGWDIGLVGMKVGGKRRIICPPNAAYGPKGSPPVIPPNATLVFDVELKKIS